MYTWNTFQQGVRGGVNKRQSQQKAERERIMNKERRQMEGARSTVGRDNTKSENASPFNFFFLPSVHDRYTTSRVDMMPGKKHQAPVSSIDACPPKSTIIVKLNGCAKMDCQYPSSCQRSMVSHYQTARVVTKMRYHRIHPASRTPISSPNNRESAFRLRKLPATEYRGQSGTKTEKRQTKNRINKT